MVKRQGLIVHFKSPKALRKIKKFVDLEYYTKKRKYAICYVNEQQKEKAMKQLQKLRLVKKVEESLIDADSYQM